MGLDASAILISYAALGHLRYYGAVPWGDLMALAGLAVAVHIFVSTIVKLYQGRAAVASTEETILIGAVTVTTAVAVVLAMTLLSFDYQASRPLPVVGSFAAAAFMVMCRAIWRGQALQANVVQSGDAQRTLVVGAGVAGEQLVRSMRRTAKSPYLPVALIDDDPWKRNRRVDGVSVIGTLRDLEGMVARHDIAIVVVAIPTARSELISSLTERCARLGVDIKVLPPVEDLLGSRASIRDVRDINVVDLLGRNAIETDIESIAPILNGKRVLVTGAGGSIGSELARQISRWHPSELMMLDRDESGLHGVQLSIDGRALLDSPDVILCDIRDADALYRIFDERRPEVVFHAAALKHLPMLEQYPAEAIKTNVIGTANVLEAARRVNVERFVNISTDKAADPTSILGYSKRVAERITADYARRDIGTYLSVRFGNVLGSRGSVLTTFADQIARGGPVTVTHPDVTRYFMTVSEAVQLVLQAGAIGGDGEILILDMGEPVRIDDVARELIRQSGRDIDIVYTGLRDGEKLDEVLRTRDENDRRPRHPLISHVTAPALSAEMVASVELERDEVPACDRLRAWCGLVDHQY
jgi:FlaA1/EpsC-like NDP-sugar epimerase